MENHSAKLDKTSETKKGDSENKITLQQKKKKKPHIIFVFIAVILIIGALKSPYFGFSPVSDFPNEMQFIGSLIFTIFAYVWGGWIIFRTIKG